MTLAPTHTAASRGRKVKWLVLILAACLTLAAALLFPALGHFSVDEIVYDMMALNLWSTGGLTVWNGYEEFASPELSLPILQIHDGRLVSQYPYLSTILVAPFYGLFGYQALIVLNAVSFVAVLGLVFLIARTLFRDADLALNASLILTFGSFAWQYSQAAWPHALSMLFVTGAFYAAISAFHADDRRKAVLLSCAAGLIVGLGTGVRLDVIFVLPAVVLPFVFANPWRPLQSLAACAGMVPGLAMLAATNYAKFGSANPFSYGVTGSGAASSPLLYLPVTALGLAVAAAAWAASRPSGRSWLAKHRLAAGLGAVVLLVAMAATPILWQTIVKLANGAYQLLVDLRVRDIGIAEPGLSRGPSGGMVYLEGLKKSLLQSCPYLAALALPIMVFLRGGQDRAALGALLLPPAAFIGVYAYFAWHGGQSHNLRYFVPVLPFTSILAAYAWQRLAGNLPSRWRLIGVAAGLAILLLYRFLASGADFTLDRQEGVLLTAPLALAAITFLSVAGCIGLGGRAGAGLRGAAAAGIVAGLVWAGLVAVTHDAYQSYTWRKLRGDRAHALAPHIASNSILFVMVADDFYGLARAARARLATPRLDDFRDFRPLIDFHLQAGRAVYLWLDPAMRAVIEERNLLGSLSTRDIYLTEDSTLVEVTRAPGQARPSAALD